MKTYTKILIATQAINWTAFRMATMNEQLRSMNNSIKDSDSVAPESKKVVAEMVSRNDRVLNELLTTLHKAAEDLIDYQDGQDAVDEADQAMLNGGLDILNNRISIE